MNGASPRITFDSYKRLTDEERSFFIFDKLCKIDNVCESLEGLDKRFAARWVQMVMTWLGGLTISSVVVALLALVIRPR